MACEAATLGQHREQRRTEHWDKSLPGCSKNKNELKSLNKQNKQDKAFKQILKPDEEERKNYNTTLYTKDIQLNATEEDNGQLMKAALGNRPIEPDEYEIAIIPEHIK